MTVMQSLPENDALMLAWRAYRETEEAKNSERWARHFVTKLEPEQGQILVHQPHLEGSLWAAFVAGYTAAKDQPHD